MTDRIKRKDKDRYIKKRKSFRFLLQRIAWLASERK